MFDLPDSSLIKTRRSLPTIGGVDVFVTCRVLANAMDVHPPFVGKGAGADKGLARTEVHVGRFVDVPRQLRQMFQLSRGQNRVVRDT